MFAAGIVLNFSHLNPILFSGSPGIFKEYIFPKFLLPDLWILKGLLGCLPFKKELPPNSFKDSNGLIEGLLGVVINTISFFSKRVGFDWVFEGGKYSLRGINVP